MFPRGLLGFIKESSRVSILAASNQNINFQEVSRKFRWCFKKVLKVFQGFSRKFQRNFKYVSNGSHGSFTAVARMFQLFLKCISRRFRVF